MSPSVLTHSCTLDAASSARRDRLGCALFANTGAQAWMLLLLIRKLKEAFAAGPPMCHPSVALASPAATAMLRPSS